MNSTPQFWTLFGQRFRKLWWLKSLGTTGFMYGFFQLYFYISSHPLSTPTSLPISPIDIWLSYRPWTWVFYASLWLYVSLPVVLQVSFWQLLYFGAANTVLCAIGLSIFYLWPTTVPTSDLEVILGSSLRMLDGIDAVGNALPSLHVAASISTYRWLSQQGHELQAKPWWGIVNGIWVLAIVLSTMTTKQHLLVDAACGWLLGEVCAYFSLQIYRNKFS